MRSNVDIISHNIADLCKCSSFIPRPFTIELPGRRNIKYVPFQSNINRLFAFSIIIALLEKLKANISYLQQNKIQFASVDAYQLFDSEIPQFYLFHFHLNFFLLFDRRTDFL